MERFTVAADCVVLALHYRFSFRQSFWDPQFAQLYVVPLVVACYTVGAITATSQ